jgi:HD-GYP domain-containing protein (c-di-GMP phosphodiesterase class II)
VPAEVTAPALNPLLECERLENLLARALRFTEPQNFRTQIDSIAQQVRELAEQHFEAAFAALLFSDGSHYPIAHHVQTALVVARLAGDAPGLTPLERQACVPAALTMNIGMLGLQTMLMTHHGPLTDAQRQAIRQHPLTSVQRLEALGIDDQDWLQMVLDHHETPTGSGYPSGSTTVGAGAQLVSLADVFCAKISQRQYRAGLPPPHAARQMFTVSGQHGPASLTSLLIAHVGVYPPGCCVRLFNGEAGIVRQHGQTAVTPEVVVVLQPDGSAYEQPIMRDTAVAAFTIVDAIERSVLPADIDLLRIWSTRF